MGQWLFPPICCFCNHLADTEQDLCSTCNTLLPWIKDVCYRCGLSIETGNAAIYCEKCLTHPPKFDRLCALFKYEPPVTQLVTGLKFKAKLAYGRLLGELLSKQVKKIWYKKEVLPEALLPVPLHKTRLRKRGFNQALELLWPIKKELSIPILIDSCLRIRPTFSQSLLNKTKRQRNMKKAFQLVKSLPFEHIALVDDVVTTASTVNVLAELLKENGVKIVDVWCVCRA